MCYDPDVSKVVLDHHCKKADKLRKQGQEKKAKQYLQNQNIDKEQIGYRYAHLKNLLEGGKQPA